MIGNRLTVLREEKKLQQKDLAEDLNLAPSTISSYERNVSEPADEIKIRIAKYFDISIDYLIGVTDLRIPFIKTDAVDLPKGFPKEEIPTVQRCIRLLMLEHEANNKLS